MLGGRVKTLHPRIHAGILARRELSDDLDTLSEHGIEPFDLVCVSLYPFSSVAGRRGTTEAEAIEMIDVGGPSMLRAAAKNFAHVAAVSSPSQYATVLDELRAHGAVTEETRRAARARGLRDDRRVRGGDRELVRRHAAVPGAADADVPEGHRPLVRREPSPGCCVLRESGARRHLLSKVEQLGGKELSYNNLADLEGARRVVREFTLPAAVIVKHANPCGVAVAATIDEAWERALAADPVSAFGCVAILNRPVGAELGRRIAEHFVEVLLAPGYDDEAVAALRREALAADPVAIPSAAPRRPGSAT